MDTIFSRDCLHYTVCMVIPSMCINGVLKQSPYSAAPIIIAVVIIITSIFVGIICDLSKYNPRTRKLRLYVYIVNAISHILTIIMLVVTLKAFENGEYNLFVITIFLTLLVWAMNEDYTNKMKESR